MEGKTNWGRIFGGFLLLALLYLIRRALNVGKNAELGEPLPNLIRPEAYQGINQLSGDALSGDILSGDTLSGDADEENLEDDL
jgi:hypothetical protein